MDQPTNEKPVNEPIFWRERLAEADALGIPHHSVYQTNEEDWRRIEETHRQIIKNHVKAGERVLDAGCGYGRLAELFESEVYTGVDFAGAFIDRAKQLYPEFRFVQAKLEDLPFPEEMFDWAICISIKGMIIGNIGVDFWEVQLAELKRVAKKVLILEYSSPEEYEIL